MYTVEFVTPACLSIFVRIYVGNILGKFSTADGNCLNIDIEELCWDWHTLNSFLLKVLIFQEGFIQGYLNSQTDNNMEQFKNDCIEWRKTFARHNPYQDYSYGG